MTQFISPTKVQLSSVAHCMDFKGNQNEPKLFKFSPFSQGIRLESGSKVKPIEWCWEDFVSIHIPTKTQLSSVARRIDFKNDRNFSNLQRFLGVYDPKVPT